ncbi:tetratricopeptide repeat protein [bacterium]|nr:MAG: tetratricopeptide repeat protein [bacterium]
MGKKKRAASEAPPPAVEAPPSWEGWGLTALWAAAFFGLALVGDQKVLRYKLLTAEAFAAAGLAWVFVSWAARAPALWRRTALDLPVTLYALGGLAYYAVAPEHGAAQGEFNRVLFSAAAFFAASQTAARLPRPELAVGAWALSGAALGLYALLQTRGGLGPLLIPQLDRPIATFGNPIFLAAFLAASACAALGLAGADARRRGLWSAVAALALAGAWTTQTRAAFAALAAVAGMWALMTLEGRRRWTALGTLALAGLGAAWFFRGRQWTHGLIWRDTLSLWLAHPWFGCGLGRFHLEFPAHASPALRALWPESKVIVNFAHNEYLQVLAETGVVGLALLAGVVGGWFRLARECAARAELPRRALLGGVLAAAGVLLVQNAASPDIRFGVSSFVVFWSLGFAAGLGWGSDVPVLLFPGRFAFAGAGLLALTLWGGMAVEPLLAQRRLFAQPSFHVEGGTEFDRAVAELEGRLKASPGDADVAENLAYLYAKASRWPEATRYFELTARLAPTRPGPFNNLGNIAYSTGDRDGAIRWWGRSLEVGPEQVDARVNLGKTLYEMGRLKESAKNLEEVLRRDPDNEKAQVLLKKMVE